MILEEFIKKSPKAELHLHIEGTLEPELMFSLAKRNNIEIPFKSINDVKKAYNFSNLDSFLKIYYEGAKVLVKAMITNRVGTGVAFMPFHFGGHFQGKDLRSKYPKGADPIVLGESSNTAQTYGYDSVTQMQETKATLCKIMPA